MCKGFFFPFEMAAWDPTTGVALALAADLCSVRQALQTRPFKLHYNNGCFMRIC